MDFYHFCIILVFLLKTEIQALICFISPDDDIFGNETQIIIYCDSKSQICCQMGCCVNPSGTAEEADFSLWTIILFVVFLIFGLCICCQRFYKPHRPRTNQVNDDGGGVNPNPQTRPPGIASISLETDQQANRQTESNQQMTPPPSYESAISAPQFHPEHRVPSYEDALRSQNAQT